MYACGVSVREIRGFLLERHGVEVAPDFISTVTDAAIDEVREWQQGRPRRRIRFVLFDALCVKIRNKAIYLVLGVRRDGTREVLGLRIELTEGANSWLRVVNDLKLRGVQDVLMAVVGRLEGLRGSDQHRIPGNNGPDPHRASGPEFAGLHQLERQEIGR